MLLHKLLNSLSNCDFIKPIYSKIVEHDIKNFNQLDKIIDQCYVDFLVYEYIKRNPNTFIAIVWPICIGGDDIMSTLNNLNEEANAILADAIAN